MAAAALLLLALAAGTTSMPVGAAGAAAAGAAALVAKHAEPRVQVALYAEALCPYCAQYTTNVMAPLLADPEFAEVVSFRFVAWGNAINGSQGVRCQHGPAECRLDRVISCATALFPQRSQWLPFLVCLEGHYGAQEEQAVQGCADSAGLDAAALQQCAEGALGDELEAAAARETAALVPPHTYVPWVTVNGIPLGDRMDDVARYVCVALPQGSRPQACYAPPDQAVGGPAAEPCPRSGGGAVEEA